MGRVVDPAHAKAWKNPYANLEFGGPALAGPYWMMSCQPGLQPPMVWDHGFVYPAPMPIALLAEAPSEQNSRQKVKKAEHWQQQQQDAAWNNPNFESMVDDKAEHRTDEEALRREKERWGHYAKLVQAIKNSEDKEAQDVVLKHLRGDMPVASRHEQGCLAVQAAFDAARTPLLFDLVGELQGHVYELSHSPWGSCVIQKAIEVLPTSHCGAVLSELSGHIQAIACHQYGCLVVQKALEVLKTDVQNDFVSELRGHVCDLIHSDWGNYVIQTVIERASQHSFVLSELLGQGDAIAKHAYGCRVYCRLLEHSNGKSPLELDKLLNELLTNVVDLCKHKYAHHVLEAVLKHGTAENKSKIGEALKGKLKSLVNHKHASRVIESALEEGHCPIDIQNRLVTELLSQKIEDLEVLVIKRYGIYVMMALAAFVRCQQVDESCQRVCAELAKSPTLAQTKNGRRFLDVYLGTGTLNDGQSDSEEF